MIPACNFRGFGLFGADVFLVRSSEGHLAGRNHLTIQIVNPMFQVDYNRINSVHDLNMAKRMNRQTPTQRNWHRMKGKQERRIPRTYIGIILVLAVSVFVVGLRLGQFSVGSPVTDEIGPMPTVIRGTKASKPAVVKTIPETHTIVGPVTYVRDGDTIEISGRAVRFAKLDCAEKGTPAGNHAGREMRTLVSGQTVSCQLTGRKSFDRWVGSCSLAGGRDLASVMIKNGICTRWRQ